MAATRLGNTSKTEINSVLVVDLPLEQDAADSYPRPYFYWLTIDRVVAFAADASSAIMKWIAFRQDDDKLVAIDDTHYRVFEYRHNTLGALLVETAHGLGYCPSRFFWSESLSLSGAECQVVADYQGVGGSGLVSVLLAVEAAP